MTSLTERFDELAMERAWQPETRRYFKERTRFVQREFTAIYEAYSKLEGLQLVCAEVGLQDIPATVTMCEKVC